jgi:TPR repeat protein
MLNLIKKSYLIILITVLTVGRIFGQQDDPDFIKAYDALKEQRFDDAVPFLEKAVNKGNKTAMALYAQLLIQGVTTKGKPDYKKADKLLTTVQENASAEDLYNIAKLYALAGAYTHPDLKKQTEAEQQKFDEMFEPYVKSTALSEKAAKMNHVPSIFQLGHNYSEGIGVTKDVKKAKELMAQAADAGSVDALNYLGAMASSASDYKDAVKWLKKAAALNSRQAMSFLSELYLFNDKGLPDWSPNKASEWAEKAEKAGN